MSLIIDAFIDNKIIIKERKFNPRFSNISLWYKRGLDDLIQHVMEGTNYLNIHAGIPERVYHIFNSLSSTPLCMNCNKPTNFKSFSKGYYTYCSASCVAKSETVLSTKKETCLLKYGVDNPGKSEIIKNKRVETNIIKYGVDNVFQNESIIEKSKLTKLDKYGDVNFNNRGSSANTCIERYGVDNPSKIQEIKNIKRDLSVEKYNSTCPMNSVEICSKIKDNWMEQYGVDNIFKSEEFICDVVLKRDLKNGTNLINLRDKDWLESQLKDKSPYEISCIVGCKIDAVHKAIRKFKLQIYNRTSKPQLGVYSFLLEYYDTSAILYNTRKIIPPKELDIYIPEKSLAIEINGVYWHSNDKTRHLAKLNLCKDKGIKLLQFWDYQWDEKQDICKSIIKSNLGLNDRVYARKCRIVELSVSEYRIFMTTNHLQGYASSSKKYGLVCDDELVSVIGFSKSRYNRNYDWELVRYANKLGTNVVGGFSRLLTHFRNTNLGSIISYCDLMVFTGGMYKENGFDFLYDSTPGFKYYKGYDIVSRETFQKHKLKDIFENYDPLLTSDENLMKNGWNKIWDCGNGVWAYE